MAGVSTTMPTTTRDRTNSMASSERRVNQDIDSDQFRVSNLLFCPLCAVLFSSTGSIIDPASPVLAVNACHNIEGPYCIRCAGQRPDLRGFQLDDARIALRWCANHPTIHPSQALQEAMPLFATKARAGLCQRQQQQEPEQQHSSSNNNNNNAIVLNDCYDTNGVGLRKTATVTVPAKKHQLNKTSNTKKPSRDAPGKNETEWSATETLPERNPQRYNHKKRKGFTSSTTVAKKKLPTHAKKQSKASVNDEAPSSKRMKPNVALHAWTPAEDAIVLEMIDRYNRYRASTALPHQPFSAWSSLAKSSLPLRTGKQVRDRYMNHLNPKLDHTTAWTEEDNALLYKAHQALGTKWVKISQQYFHERQGENRIKNRFYSADFRKYTSARIQQEENEGQRPAMDNGQDHKENQASTKDETRDEEILVTASSRYDDEKADVVENRSTTQSIHKNMDETKKGPVKQNRQTKYSLGPL